MALTLKQATAKSIRFTITDEDTGDAVDVSSGTFTLAVKQDKDDAVPLITKADGDFDKTNAASGIVDVPFSTTDTNQTASDEYVLELTVVLSAANITKSQDFKLIIQQSVVTS